MARRFGFAAAIVLSGCGFITKLQARNLLNKGVTAFTEQKYTEAAKYFEDSIRLDPTFVTPRLYLATAYTSQFVPGSPDPRVQNGEEGDRGVSTVIDLDKANPNVNAMVSIASLYYQLNDTEKSKEWCRNILQVDPKMRKPFTVSL